MPAMAAAQGRGSASNAPVLSTLALFCCLLLMTSTAPLAEAATYMVGDSGGWKFNTVEWPSGKIFRAGDVLVFNYNPAVHNVAVVGAAGYRSCTVPRRAKVLRSGHDRVRLRSGTHYFVCGVPGHCQAGMKVAVKVV